MTAPHADQLIDGYLARLNSAAADVPKSARQELVGDVRAHIAEARAREPEETDATILNIFDRLGEPGVVVADARERLGLRVPAPYRPGVLEIAALILVPFFWPVGVILLWVSPAWNMRDKVIGTLLPPGGYLGTLTFALFAASPVTSGGCVIMGDAAANVVANTCAPAGPQWPQVIGTALLFGVVFAMPLVTAAYLGLRLRWGRPARQLSPRRESLD